MSNQIKGQIKGITNIQILTMVRDEFLKYLATYQIIRDGVILEPGDEKFKLSLNGSKRIVVADNHVFITCDDYEMFPLEPCLIRNVSTPLKTVLLSLKKEFEDKPDGIYIFYAGKLLENIPISKLEYSKLRWEGFIWDMRKIPEFAPETPYIPIGNV